MNNLFESRFIIDTDPQFSSVIFALPKTWWSRGYEYAWASQFAKKNHIVLDAACGISHPFKFFLNDHCKELYACDIDSRITSPQAILKDIETNFGKEAAEKLPKKYLEEIIYCHADLKMLPYTSNKFDVIFCISVIEHLPVEDIRLVLKEFKRIIKDTGVIVLTVDWPSVDLRLFRNMIIEAGLDFAGYTSFQRPDNAITSEIWGKLYCFRMVLRKNDKTENSLNMEEYSAQQCPLCLSPKITVFNKYASFTLLCCKSCDLIFQDKIDKVDITTLVNDVYDINWVSMRDKYLHSTFLEHAAFNNMLLNIFTPEKGELLEIGSGTGEFLYMARAAGWKTHGIEPSAASRAYAVHKYNVILTPGFWDPSLFNNDLRFDVVTFWHLLEHIMKPQEFFRELASVLKSNGQIYFSVPNKDSLTNKFYGCNSPLFTERDHFFHYSKKSLSLLMEQTPFSVVALFSREEANRLQSDIKASLNKSNIYADITFPEMMTLMAQSQADFEGHELFCVARKK